MLARGGWLDETQPGTGLGLAMDGASLASVVKAVFEAMLAQLSDVSECQSGEAVPDARNDAKF